MRVKMDANYLNEGFKFQEKGNVHLRRIDTLKYLLSKLEEFEAQEYKFKLDEVEESMFAKLKKVLISEISGQNPQANSLIY